MSKSSLSKFTYLCFTLLNNDNILLLLRFTLRKPIFGLLLLGFTLLKPIFGLLFLKGSSITYF